MPDRETLRSIRTFPSLVKYLRDDMDWPIESDDFEDLTFDYEPGELGIDAKTAAKIEQVKQLRPLVTNQPWGIFFVKFAPKRLPVVALRRTLSGLVIKKRATARSSEQAAWALNDLLFISNYGEDDERRITFAHFSEDTDAGDLPTLKVLGWDGDDTSLHIDDVADKLTGKLSWPDDTSDAETWRTTWASAFTLRHREVITTSKRMAERLAELARSIRKKAEAALAIESETGPLKKLMKAFQQSLIHDLNESAFADMYAQTIAYGLLSARVSRESGRLVADDAALTVPVTNPFLRELMETFLRMGGRKRSGQRSTGIDFDELGVNEVVQMLREANMEAVVRDFGDRNPLEDPVIHFYELFAKEYDPIDKIRRGEFYTPRPVVSYIVRSVHELLQTEFGLEAGLADTATWGEMAERHEGLTIPDGVKPADRFVTILDPATGTGTFLVEVIEVIHHTLVEKWTREGHSEDSLPELWNDYVPRHLLPRLHAYELKMAPYAIAHLKIGLALRATDFTAWARLTPDDRMRIYLTNALEPASDSKEQKEFEEWIPALAHEAQAVNEIKRKQRFTVVIGNPPYAGHSANKGIWIEGLVDAYFQVNGEPLNEANSKWLRDDYVKFIRLGQELMRDSGSGAFSFITNHGYIDNPTFRGMRASMLSDFAQLWITDLHGNTKKNDKSADGTNDENVFDIQQGVAVFVAERKATGHQRSAPLVWHSSIRGNREGKYAQMRGSTMSAGTPVRVRPAPPFLLLAPQDEDARDEYEGLLPLITRTTESSLGVLTKRDSLVVAFTAEELAANLHRFSDMRIPDESIAEEFGLPLRDKDKWDLGIARRRHRDTEHLRIRSIQYRPFDSRFVYYDPTLVARMNQRVLRHVEAVPKNRALIIGRQGMATGSDSWDVCYICSGLADQNIYRRGGGTVLPLYLAPDTAGLGLVECQVNFPQELARSFACFRAAPEDIFDYIYAVLYAPSYRSRYADFLKIDFPRLPLTSDLELFRELARLGGELVALHLLESPVLGKSITQWRGSTPSGEVEKISYADGTVWINKTNTEGFRGVPEDVWNFHIGGYQVCEKWLKDRKGRTLSEDDITHYQKIVVALSKTIRIMAEIDDVIESHGGWPDAFADKGGRDVGSKNDPVHAVASGQPAPSDSAVAPTLASHSRATKLEQSVDPPAPMADRPVTAPETVSQAGKRVTVNGRPAVVLTSERTPTGTRWTVLFDGDKKQRVFLSPPAKVEEIG